MPKTPRVPTPEKLREKWDGLFAALNDQNDTICAIVSASHVEHCVRALLRRHMVNGDTARDLIDPGKGAIGLIHTASQLAYAMGLISVGCMQRIQTIGLIRNLFAHSIDNLTFDDPEVVKLCDTLLIIVPSQELVVSNDPGRTVEEIMASITSTPRARFRSIATMLCAFMMTDALSAEHRKERIDKWPVVKREQPSREGRPADDSGPKG